MPTASIINYRAREIRANATIVKIGSGGAIDLFGGPAHFLYEGVPGFDAEFDAVLHDADGVGVHAHRHRGRDAGIWAPTAKIVPFCTAADDGAGKGVAGLCQ